MRRVHPHGGCVAAENVPLATQGKGWLAEKNDSTSIAGGDSSEHDDRQKHTLGTWDCLPTRPHFTDWGILLALMDLEK